MFREHSIIFANGKHHQIIKIEGLEEFPYKRLYLKDKEEETSVIRTNVITKDLRLAIESEIIEFKKKP